VVMCSVGSARCDLSDETAEDGSSCVAMWITTALTMDGHWAMVGVLLDFDPSLDQLADLPPARRRSAKMLTRHGYGPSPALVMPGDEGRSRASGTEVGVHPRGVGRGMLLCFVCERAKFLQHFFSSAEKAIVGSTER
jgi:hypothetical protein